MAKEIIKFDVMRKTWNKISKFHDGLDGSNFELEVYKKCLICFIWALLLLYFQCCYCNYRMDERRS